MTFLGMPARAPRGVGHLRGDEPFPVAARKALANPQLRRNLHHATTTIRDKSGRVVAELPDWQELRSAGSALKAYTMANLPALLEQLERKAVEDELRIGRRDGLAVGSRVRHAPATDECRAVPGGRRVDGLGE